MITTEMALMAHWALYGEATVEEARQTYPLLEPLSDDDIRSAAASIVFLAGTEEEERTITPYQAVLEGYTLVQWSPGWGYWAIAGTKGDRPLGADVTVIPIAEADDFIREYYPDG